MLIPIRTEYDADSANLVVTNTDGKTYVTVYMKQPLTKGTMDTILKHLEELHISCEVEININCCKNYTGIK